MKLTQKQAQKILNNTALAFKLTTETFELLSLISERTIRSADLDLPSERDTKLINEALGRKPKPELLPLDTTVALENLADFLFVVNAHSGRYNGCALVTANNKVEARSIAKNSGWLDRGQVDNAITFREWVEEVGDDLDEELAEMIREFPTCNTIGDCSEIDWGT